MWCKEERKFELIIYSNTQNDDSIREIHTCTSDCDYVISCRQFLFHMCWKIKAVTMKAGQRKSNSKDLWACGGDRTIKFTAKSSEFQSCRLST